MPVLWAALAQQFDGQDRWFLEALGIGADQQWDRCLDAWLAQVGEHWNTAAGRELIWRSRGRKTPALLVKLINDPGTSAQQRDQLMSTEKDNLQSFLQNNKPDLARESLAATLNCSPAWIGLATQDDGFDWRDA